MFGSVWLCSSSHPSTSAYASSLSQVDMSPVCKSTNLRPVCVYLSVGAQTLPPPADFAATAAMDEELTKRRTTEVRVRRLTRVTRDHSSHTLRSGNRHACRATEVGSHECGGAVYT